MRGVYFFLLSLSFLYAFHLSLLSFYKYHDLNPCHDNPIQVQKNKVKHAAEAAAQAAKEEQQDVSSCSTNQNTK